MQNRRADQSDFMTSQLVEIERFRFNLSQQGHDNITLQEAMVLWISEGYADEFRTTYLSGNDSLEPAIAS